MDQLPAFKSVVQLMAKLNTDLACRLYLQKLIWNSDKPSACPRCGHTTTYSFSDGKTHKCASCRKKFNLFTGTIFENTKLPLNKWIAAIWLATSYKRGVSSYQIQKLLDVTQPTAWFIMHRIRMLFGNLKASGLEGTCTADETFIGGKNKNRHRDKKVKGAQGRGSYKDKISVFGVMQVGGMVITKAVPDTQTYTLVPLVVKYVKPGSTFMSDEWQGYNGVNKTHDHIICSHNRGQYVAENGATTNPIENYWSHVKRAVIGTYYHISRKHIERYLAHTDFQFNYRGLSDNDKFRLVLSNTHNTRLKYQQLIQ